MSRSLEKWFSIFGPSVTHSNKSNGSRKENEGARRRAMLLLEVVEPVAFDALHLPPSGDFVTTRGLTGLGFFRQVESSLSRRRDFEVTAWVAGCSACRCSVLVLCERPLDQ